MKYRVLITALALEDIADLFDYVKTAFSEPAIASKIKSAILDAIDSLEQFPYRVPAEKEEPYHTQGIRKLLVKNYYVIYHVVGENVVILRVLYNRHEWQDIL